MKYLIILFFIILMAIGLTGRNKDNPAKNPQAAPNPTNSAQAVLAGGCFWCVEADFEKLSGVLDVVSGYSGSKRENPNYGNYAELGQREVVEVTYDPARVDYPTLVEYLIRHSDPTDPDGSFNDRGPQYAPAVFYVDEKEKAEALSVIKRIDERKIFARPLALQVLPREKFWPAEEYHQDYARKNPLRYKYYRHGSGRDAFIQKYWGDNVFPEDAEILKREQAVADLAAQDAPWKDYHKPGPEELKKILTPLQYKVTQEEGTEKPFDNPYDANQAEGLYVDVLSGEPLFSSVDKYDSGTGWPSFVRPIFRGAVVEKEDRGFFTTRVEIRSKYGDNHIGHVFPDGPADRGGKRYCMNSAALRFVSKDTMKKEGYEAYIKYVE